MWCSGKEYSCQCRRHRRLGFNPWFRKIPWRRKWQLTSVFLLRKSDGQRNLAGHSPWSGKELEVTERLSMHTHTHTHILQYTSQIEMYIPLKKAVS